MRNPEGISRGLYIAEKRFQSYVKPLFPTLTPPPLCFGVLIWTRSSSGFRAGDDGKSSHEARDWGPCARQTQSHCFSPSSSWQMIWKLVKTCSGRSCCCCRCNHAIALGALYVERLRGRISSQHVVLFEASANGVLHLLFQLYPGSESEKPVSKSRSRKSG